MTTTPDATHDPTQPPDTPATAAHDGSEARILWAHPAIANSPFAADKLLLRLDFYGSSIQLTGYDDDEIPARSKSVSAHSIADVITANTRTRTGILPEGALWQSIHPAGAARTALWTPPQRRRLALSLRFDEPTQRFNIPLPGLIFICSPESPPTVFAAKYRPTSPQDRLYQAPLFNLFNDGTSCQGTHKYQPDVSTMPEEFLNSWFTLHGNNQKRSHRHEYNLMDLWNDLHNKDEYPLEDLVYWGTIQDATE